MTVSSPKPRSVRGGRSRDRPRVQGGLGDNDMPGSELEMNLFFKHMTLILKVQDSLTIVHSQLNLNHMSILYYS